MTSTDHERARSLVLIRDVEGIGQSEGTWLESHLTTCADCAAFTEDLQRTSQALSRMPVMASASLVSSTQAQVRQRAVELREQQARNFLIGISFCLGLLWSAGSAFVGFRLSGWVADKIHVAPWIIATAFVVFWLAPAIAIAIGLLVHHPLSSSTRADWLTARVKEELL